MTDPWGHRSHRGGHRRFGAWTPSGRDLIQVGSTSRRWFLQAGLSGLGRAIHGADPACSRRRRARRTSLAEPERRSKVGHPVVALGWPKPSGHVGPQARCRQRGARPIRHDRDPSAGRSVLRTPASAGRDHGQADGAPLGRLLGEHSHADHDAGGQPAGSPHRQRPGRRRVSLDGLDRRQIPRAQRPITAGVRGPGR